MTGPKVTSNGRRGGLPAERTTPVPFYKLRVGIDRCAGGTTAVVVISDSRGIVSTALVEGDGTAIGEHISRHATQISIREDKRLAIELHLDPSMRNLSRTIFDTVFSMDINHLAGLSMYDGSRGAADPPPPDQISIE